MGGRRTEDGGRRAICPPPARLHLLCAALHDRAVFNPDHASRALASPAAPRPATPESSVLLSPKSTPVPAVCLGLALTPALPARCVRSPSTITSKKKRGHDVHAQSIEKRSHSESLSRECRALQPGASSATETFWRMAAWSAQRPSSGAQSTFAQRDTRSIATLTPI